MRLTKTYCFLLTLIISFTLFNCKSDDDATPYTPTPTKVYEGDVVLSSQDEVDAFGLESYNEITGYLYIGINDPNAVNQTTDISDLNALSSITNTQNGLVVYNNPGLENLEGLNNLTYMNSGPLEIVLNDNLTSINALSRLLSFKSLYIEDNAMLLNLDGLENVQNAREGIVISNNTALININGLSGITYVGGEYMFIKGNDALANINGLSNLEVVDGNLVVSNINSTSLSLGSLEMVGLNLFISKNSMLTNLDSLETLEQVGGSISINENAELTNFCGLVPLVESGSFSGSFSTQFNAYNPTISDLNDADCSM